MRSGPQSGLNSVEGQPLPAEGADRYVRMTIPRRDEEEPTTDGRTAGVYEGGMLAALAAVALAMFLFVLATVNHRPAAEVQSHAAARRSSAVVNFWKEHGYFSSGGMVAFPAPAGERAPFVFYRSTPGGWMVPSYVVATIATAIEGRYDWILIARFNLAVAALTATLLGWLAYAMAKRLGIGKLQAFALGASVLVVDFTFPDMLAFYWEPSPQAWAIGLWICFLIVDDVRGRRSGRALRRATVLQAVIVFAFIYVDYVTSVLFLAAHTLIVLLLSRGRSEWRSWLLRVAVPAGAALLLYGLQLAYVRTRYPEIPMTGSSFMERTGLDGGTDYYRDHSDIISGRGVARRNFPHNREWLFKWPALFGAGILAFIFLLLVAARGRLPEIVVLSLFALTGTYIFYGAIFSQATVIHPYLFDVLLVTPVIMAVFSVVPAVLESMTGGRGVFILAIAFAAAWYSMVQLRSYALWYPLAPPRAAAAAGQQSTGAPATAGKEPRTAWAVPPFEPTRFGATTGQWKVEPKNVVTFSYARQGATMVVNFKLTGTTLTERTTTLQIRLPDQAMAAARVEAPFLYSADGVAFNVGQMVVVPDQQMMYLQHLGAASDFFPAKGTVAVAGSMTFETK